MCSVGSENAGWKCIWSLGSQNKQRRFSSTRPTFSIRCPRQVVGSCQKSSSLKPFQCWIAIISASLWNGQADVHTNLELWLDAFPADSATLFVKVCPAQCVSPSSFNYFTSPFTAPLRVAIWHSYKLLSCVQSFLYDMVFNLKFFSKFFVLLHSFLFKYIPICTTKCVNVSCAVFKLSS